MLLNEMYKIASKYCAKNEMLTKPDIEGIYYIFGFVDVNNPNDEKDNEPIVINSITEEVMMYSEYISTVD